MNRTEYNALLMRAMILFEMKERALEEQQKWSPEYWVDINDTLRSSDFKGYDVTIASYDDLVAFYGRIKKEIRELAPQVT